MRETEQLPPAALGCGARSPCCPCAAQRARAWAASCS